MCSPVHACSRTVLDFHSVCAGMYRCVPIVVSEAAGLADLLLRLCSSGQV